MAFYPLNSNLRKINLLQIPTNLSGFSVTASGTTQDYHSNKIINLFDRVDDQAGWYMEGRNYGASITIECPMSCYLYQFRYFGTIMDGAGAGVVKKVKIEGSNDNLSYTNIGIFDVLNGDRNYANSDKPYKYYRISAYSGTEWVRIDSIQMYFSKANSNITENDWV